MTNTCPSCGKTLEVFSADEGTCSYAPGGCQLEQDLEAARRVPTDLFPCWDRWSRYPFAIKIDSIDYVQMATRGNNCLDVEGQLLIAIHNAACAAPRLAVEVERLREENKRLRECAERVSHAWKFIDPDNIKIMSDAVTALDEALARAILGSEGKQ